MTALTARQQLTASNIANADTPGYKTKDLDFAGIMTAGSASPYEVQGLAVKNDGNNVSIDREAGVLAETALKFNIATQFMNMQIRAARAAIQEGR